MSANLLIRVLVNVTYPDSWDSISLCTGVTAISYHPFPERIIGLSVSFLEGFGVCDSGFFAGFDGADLEGCLRSFASTRQHECQICVQALPWTLVFGDFFFFFLGISRGRRARRLGDWLSSWRGISRFCHSFHFCDQPFICFQQLLVRSLEHMNTVFESLHFGPFVQHLLSKILQLRFDGAHVDFVHLSAYILEIFTVPFQAFLSFIDSLQQSLFSGQSLPPLLLDFGAIFVEGRNLDHCGLVFGLDIFKFRHDLFAHFGESLIEIAFAQSSDLLSQGGDILTAAGVRVDGHAHALVDAPKVVKWSHDQCLANAGPRKGLKPSPKALGNGRHRLYHNQYALLRTRSQNARKM
ncbi:hypothetical protein KC320_g269 [Hortaea werneckii]|nr:hypothetical protein KC320_g269 [Hortaea werneckii]